MRQSSIYIFGLFLLTACKLAINPTDVESVVLIQTSHPYIGDRVDSIKLDDKLIPEFLIDFANKKEEVFKFYSCHIIRIRLKDGQLVNYRTNGRNLEKIGDNNSGASYFKLNKDINLVSKYWKIPEEQFCATEQFITKDIKGKWYLNKWTMYHTLSFSDASVFVDNHVDSVFTLDYSLSKDTLILKDDNSKVAYREKIMNLTKDTLVIRSFGNNQNILRYSRTKREWSNE